MNKKIKVREKLKSAAIFMLFILMTTFLSIYIVRMQRDFAEKQTIPLDKMWIFRNQDSLSGSARLSTSSLIPEFIGYRSEGGISRGIRQNPDLMVSVYGLLSEYIKKTFSSGYVCRILQQDEGSEKWSEAIRSDSFVYIKYQSELPYPLIHMFCCEENISSPGIIASGDVVYVDELIFARSKDGKGVNIYSRGSDSIAVFEPSDTKNGIEIDFSLLKAYDGSKDFYEFEFALNTNSSLSESAVLLKSSINTKKIMLDPGIYYILNSENENSNNLLKLFGFNTELVNKYTEENGSSVYVSTDARLEISTDGRITYTLLDETGGIDFKKLLNYDTGSGQYDIYEYIKAAAILAEILSNAECEVWKNAYPYISGVEKDGKGIVKVKYDLYFENILMYFGEGKHAAEFSLFEGKVISAVIEASHPKSDFYGEKMVSFDWMLKNTGDIPLSSSVTMIYDLRNRSSSGNNSVVWAFESTSSEGRDELNELEQG